MWLRLQTPRASILSHSQKNKSEMEIQVQWADSEKKHVVEEVLRYFTEVNVKEQQREHTLHIVKVLKTWLTFCLYVSIENKTLWVYMGEKCIFS